MREITTNLLFVYGILKRGKALDLSRHGGKFFGKATLRDANIYRIGGGVGLRLNEPGGFVHGEVFEIPDVENAGPRLWKWLDDIENNGVTYTRKVVKVELVGADYEHDVLDENDVLEAWVYEHNHAHFRESEKIQDGVYRGNY